MEEYEIDGSAGQKPQIYFSFDQLPDEALPIFRGEVTLAVRTAGDPASAIAAIRKAVADEARDEPVYNVHTMAELAAGSIGRQRFPMILLMAFAALALVLAFVGLTASSRSRRRNARTRLEFAWRSGPIAAGLSA